MSINKTLHKILINLSDIPLDMKPVDENKKPTKEFFESIQNNKSYNTPQSMTMNRFKNCVINGCAFNIGIFNGDRKIHDKTQMYGLDIDNNDPQDIIQMKDYIEHFKLYGLDPTFAYYTYSSNEDIPKYRIIFSTGFFIEDKNYKYTELIKNLIFAIARLKLKDKDNKKVFDLSCKDKNRIFFGTKNQDYYYDESNIYTSIGDLIYVVYTNLLKNINKINYKRDVEYLHTFLNIQSIDIVEEKTENCIECNEYGKYLIIEFKDQNYKPATITPNNNIKPIPLSDIKLDMKVLKLLKEKCKLIEYFCDNKYLNHNDRFELAWFLAGYKNGVALYNKYLKAINRTHCNCLNELKKGKYYLNKNCKHTSCGSEHNMKILYDNLISNNKINFIKYHKINNYISLVEARKQTKKALYDAFIDPNKNTIHIVDVETGIGKTTELINFTNKNYKKIDNILYAFPRHDLKEEFINNLSMFSKKDFTIQNNYSQYIKDIGEDFILYANSKKSVSGLLKEKIGEEVSGRYKNELYEMYHKSQLVTTHHRAINCFNKTNMINTIVFDESPIDCLFYFVKISYKELIKFRETLNNAKYDPKNKEKIPLLDNCIKTITDVELGLNDFLNKNKFKLTKSEENFISKYLNFEYKTPVLDLFNSTIISKNEKGRKCTQVSVDVKKELNPNNKYIVLSATPDINKWKLLYPNFKIIHHKIDPVKPYNKIIQIMGNTSTKYSIVKDPNFFKILNSNIENYMFNKTFEKYNIITYKNYIDYFDGTIKLNFGGCSGLNTLSDDPLVVIGRLCINHNDLFLMYQALHKKILTNAEKKPTTRMVTFENVTFKIYTYKNQNLQNLHLYMMYKELKQAVGRARLINKKNLVILITDFILYETEVFENFNDIYNYDPFKEVDLDRVDKSIDDIIYDEVWNMESHIKYDFNNTIIDEETITELEKV